MQRVFWTIVEWFEVRRARKAYNLERKRNKRIARKVMRVL